MEVQGQSTSATGRVQGRVERQAYRTVEADIWTLFVKKIHSSPVIDLSA